VGVGGVSKAEVRRYRSLHISDIHMSNSLPHAKQTDARGITDRLADQLDLWKRVFAAATRARCESIFIQGDLFDHSRTDAITLTETFRMIGSAPVPVFIVPGNHDGVNTRGERFTVEALSELPRCSYMETGWAYRPRPWLTFWPMEFSPLQRTREALKAMKLQSGEVNVLLMHNSIVGCTHSGWTCEDGMGLMAAELTDRFDHVLSGHFHDEQRFGSKQNGRYLGAPMHHRFDDVGRPAGFWVMEFRSTGERKEVFVDGGAPRFHTVRYTKEARGELNARRGDYVRVIVRCTHAKLIKKQIAATRYVDTLLAQGLRASWVHEPVYHHVSRLAVKSDDGTTEVLTPRKMVSGYVEAVEVDTTGLDRKALRHLGREIFTAVEGEWRG
jgi:DNA repair exonuclease SbcCD nuclease subunit